MRCKVNCVTSHGMTIIEAQEIYWTHSDFTNISCISWLSTHIMMNKQASNKISLSKDLSGTRARNSLRWCGYILDSLPNCFLKAGKWKPQKKNSEDSVKTIWDGHTTGSQDTKCTAAKLICLTRTESVNGGMVKVRIRYNVIKHSWLLGCYNI